MPPKTPHSTKHSTAPPVQDLKPVVFHNARASIKNATGHLRHTIQKKTNPDGKRLAGLDAATADGTQKKQCVSKAFRTALIQARVTKKWKQKDLAQNANVKLQELTNLEKGTMVGGVEGVRRKLNRALGVELPGVVEK